MYDLISIGDITIDLFFKGESLTIKDNRFYLAIGGKYHVENFYESLGGGGANVAAGAAHFGFSTAVIGKIGENAFKQIIIQKLIKKTVSCEFLLIEKGYLNISSIFLTLQGERTIVHYNTPHENFSLNENIKRQIAKTKMVYMGNLPNIIIKERQEILSIFKKNKALICLNLGIVDCRRPFSELNALINQADIFILNTYEFAELIKKDRLAIDFKKDCSIYLKYQEKILILTDGENGSYLYHRGKVYFQKAVIPKKIIDTTGAGDAYTSGFLAAYIKDSNFEEAMHQGAFYASEIINKIGAQ